MRLCAVSVIGRSETPKGTMLHHRTLFVEADNRDDAEFNGKTEVASTLPGVEIISCLVDPVPRRRTSRGDRS